MEHKGSQEPFFSMIKLAFCILVFYIMARNFLAWMAIDKNISAAKSWNSTKAELLDHQVLSESGKGIKRFQSNRQSFALAKFNSNGKTIWCQRISFYPNSHIINVDYISQWTDETEVNVWFDPTAPGNCVLLDPEEHNSQFLLMKTIFVQASCLSLIALTLLV